jgi:hypothetical protein
MKVSCQICGVEFEVSKYASKRRKYCDRCAKKVNNKLARDYARKNKERIKARRSKRKLCSRGCGRPVGEGLRKLSTYCFKNSQNDADDWHNIGK